MMIEVAKIFTESEERIVIRLVPIMDAQTKLLERLIALEQRMADRQDQHTEALGLILEKMRKQ